MSDVIYIEPSGSAAADTANIAEAVAALSFDVSDTATGYYRVGTIKLSGRYLIERTIETGVRPDGRKCRPVLFDGQGQSSLYGVRGMSGPLLRIGGSGRSRATRVQDIAFYCCDLGGAVEFVNQSYCELMRNCLVMNALGYGVRVTGGFESHIDNCQIHARGVCLWASGFNSASATRIKFGCTAGEWPSNLPADQRAACVIDGNGARLESIAWETCRMGEYPLLWCRPSAMTLHHARWEKNSNTLCKIVADGSGAWWDGLGLDVAYVSGGDSDVLGAGGCRSVIELRGTTDRVQLRESMLSGFAVALVYAANGTHKRVKVENVSTRANDVPRWRYVSAAEGAEIALAQ